MVMFDIGKVKLAVRSWFNRKTFAPEELRGVLMGTVLTTTLAEIRAYTFVKQNIESGEMPSYMTDFLIVMLSVFEGVIAPFISWWGFQRRRPILIAYSTAVLVAITSWFFLPGVKETTASDLCNITGENTKFDGMTTNAVIRLVILVLCCICFIVARVGCWSHGVAYSDEYAPSSTSLHYGILLLARIISLVLGYNIMDNNLIRQIVLLLFGQTFNVIRLFFIIPKAAPEVDGEQKTDLPLDNRGFFLTIGRVLHSSVALSQMLAMGLMGAALWGYGYSDLDIVAVKFNVIPYNGFVGFLIKFLPYEIMFVFVLFFGLKFSAPLMMKFSNLKAIKQVIVMSVLSLLLYVGLTTVVRCNTSQSGLIRSFREASECSLQCNCDQTWINYQPVCSAEDMLTYKSPCHAGCNSSEIINDVFVYSNCSCSATGRVTVGACSDADCRPAYHLHAILFSLTVIFTILAFQAQGVLLLRVVDQRDKSVVMGLAWSAVAIISFVSGHLLFSGIRGVLCKVNEVGQCEERNKMFPIVVGATSAFLVLLSIIISIGSWMSIRMKEDKVEEISR